MLAWPPAPFDTAQARMRERETWYTGDPSVSRFEVVASGQKHGGEPD